MNRLKLAAKGGALLLAIVLMAALAIISIVLMELATSSNSNTANSDQRMQALQLAQAGLADMVNLTNQSGIPVPGTTHSANWGSQQSYTVTVISAASNDYFPVRSTGTVSLAMTGGATTSVSRTLEAYIKYNPGSPDGGFPALAFARRQVTITGNLMTDSYDSGARDTDGNPIPYGGTLSNGKKNIGSFGNVGTNGTISLGGSATINGDLNPGPGQTIAGSPPSPPPPGVTGQVVPLETQLEFTDPTTICTAPASAGAAVSCPSAIGADGQNTTVHIDSISAGFVVRGNVTIYLDGSLKLAGSGTSIQIFPGAKLTIYQAAGTGIVDIHGCPGIVQTDSSGATLTSQFSNRFNFISAATGNEGWHGNADFYGNVYAPFSTVDFTGNGVRFGAVIADVLKLGGGSIWHADTNARSSVFATPGKAVLASTRELNVDQ